jgi:hypothetical protein
MKKLFGPAWLSAWVMGLLPDRAFQFGKKTPWYRRSWMANTPWIGAVLMAPFVAFVLWKGTSMLMARRSEQKS